MYFQGKVNHFRMKDQDSCNLQFPSLCSSSASLPSCFSLSLVRQQRPRPPTKGTQQFSATFHTVRSTMKDSKDGRLPDILWRQFIVQGWYFLFLNMSCALDVFFSNNSPPEASATDDCWQSEPELYILSIGLQADWFKNTLPSFSLSSLELCQNADICALVFTLL